MKWRALFLTLLLGLSVAAAASLQLSAPQRPYATTAHRCAENIHFVVSQNAAIFDAPAECEGMAGQLRVRESNAERIINIETLTLTNEVQFSPKVKDIDTLFFAIDSWPIPTSWEYDRDENDYIDIWCEGDCSLKDLQILHPQDTPPHYHVTGKITTTSTDPVQWKLIFNASSDLLPFLAGRLATDQYFLSALEDVDCQADQRIVEIGPTGSEWDGRLEAGRDITFGLYGWKDPGIGGFRTIFDCPTP